MKVMDSAKLCQRYIIKELRLSIVGLVLRTLLTCLMQVNLIQKEWREASLVSECTKWAELVPFSCRLLGITRTVCSMIWR